MLPTRTAWIWTADADMDGRVNVDEFVSGISRMEDTPSKADVWVLESKLNKLRGELGSHGEAVAQLSAQMAAIGGGVSEAAAKSPPPSTGSSLSSGGRARFPFVQVGFAKNVAAALVDMGATVEMVASTPEGTGARESARAMPVAPIDNPYYTN